VDAAVRAAAPRGQGCRCRHWERYHRCRPARTDREHDGCSSAHPTADIRR
jgi:hypothetical protein